MEVVQKVAQDFWEHASHLSSSAVPAALELFTSLMPTLTSTLGFIPNGANAQPVLPSEPTTALQAKAPTSGLQVGLQLLLEPQSSRMVFRAACNTAALVYPVYATFKTIEDKITDAQDIQWLTYWTIYGGLSLIENFADQTLASVPFYYHIKFAFLLWLQLPQTQGAKCIYQHHFRPLLKKYEPKVDQIIVKSKEMLETFYVFNKGPIDAMVAAVLYASAYIMSSFRWFFSSDDRTDTSRQHFIS